MEIHKIIILVTCFIEVLLCFYSMIRNNWVYKNRIAFIGTKEYNKLQSYESMVWGHRFWCWDFKSFIKE